LSSTLKFNIPRFKRPESFSEEKKFLHLNFWHSLKKLKLLPRILTPKETSAIRLLIFVIMLATVVLVAHWYIVNSKILPDEGGDYIEGVVGAPNLINPILAQTNEVDQDIARLLFNGLFKLEDGKLLPDLVESYSITPNQLEYTFKLKSGVSWHDGEPFTAGDVVFTLESIQNPEFKSPLYTSLAGVNVKQIDDNNLTITLPQPFAPFLSLLTFGILPEHIWADIPPTTAHLANVNLKSPVGTGPFKIKSLKKDSRGVIKSYTLTRNDKFYSHTPYLNSVTFKFYTDAGSLVSALNNKNIDGIHYLPQKYQAEITNKNVTIKSLSLPQYSAIFFNPTKNSNLNVLEIRQALAMAVNRTELVQQALHDQGSVIYGPILPGFIGYSPDIKKYDYQPQETQAILIKAGWKKISADDYQNLLATAPTNTPAGITTATGTAITTVTPTASPPPQPAPSVGTQEYFWQKDQNILSITLTTVDNPETAAAATLIKKQWENIGVKVNLNIVDKDRLIPDIIKPRQYEALLFGQIVGYDPDPYAFWHSSQINYPGVNLAMYSNKKIDGLLEEARKISDVAVRTQKYREFQQTINNELPAIFLYNPTYPYVLSKQIKGFTVERIAAPADRFNTIADWYIKTKRQLNFATTNSTKTPL